MEPAAYEEGWRVYLAEAVKKVVNIPVITGGMIRNPSFANHVLAEKKADFVFLGRSLLADPEWANKARENKIEDIRPCISCNNCIGNNFKGLGIRCTVNPYTGRHNILSQENLVQQKARAVVVGGGPAGMQAAISLQRHGLEVFLYEKEAKLGGFMNVTGVPPHKEQILAWRDYMIRELGKARIKVVLNCKFTRDILQEIKPEILGFSLIGDALKVRGFKEAILEGEMLGNIVAGLL